MAHESNGQMTYLEELLICGLKPTIQKEVKEESNTKFTPIGNKLISKNLIFKFEKIRHEAKEAEKERILRTTNYTKFVNSIPDYELRKTTTQVILGNSKFVDDHITIINIKNGNMQNCILGEI